MAREKDWRAVNRANWDERWRSICRRRCTNWRRCAPGRSRLGPIEEAELGPVAGLRGAASAMPFRPRQPESWPSAGPRWSASISPAPAIAAARGLADELGLAERARFVEADLYDAPAAIPEPGAFDLVYVTWGAIYWLPDIRRWAEIVAHFSSRAAALYLAEGHPAALVLDDMAPPHGAMPGWFVPYFLRGSAGPRRSRDYADRAPGSSNARTYEWLHPLGEVVTGLIDAGLTPALAARARTRCLADVQDPGRGWRTAMYRWPERPWLPLAFSLRAERPL